MERYYRHFKGGKYILLEIGRNSETLEKVVVYRALYGDGEVWVRPYDMFFGEVQVNGETQKRFTAISKKEAYAK